MANINFTPEQLKAAKMCISPEELVAKAKELGHDIPLEQAAVFLNPEAAKAEELADEELDNVAGGGCGSSQDDQEKWRQQAAAEGRYVKVCLHNTRDNCSACGTNASVYAVGMTTGDAVNDTDGYVYKDTYFDTKCYFCGKKHSTISDKY